jgi:hypothetical protein
VMSCRMFVMLCRLTMMASLVSGRNLNPWLNSIHGAVPVCVTVWPLEVADTDTCCPWATFVTLQTNVPETNEQPIASGFTVAPVTIKVIGNFLGDPVSWAMLEMMFPWYVPGARPDGATETVIEKAVVPVVGVTESHAWSVVRVVNQWHVGTPAGGGQGELSCAPVLWPEGMAPPCV